MRYPIESTAWLSERMGENVKNLIATFYELADSRESDAGARMAADVFSSDAVLVSAHATFRGSAEISKSRDNAWAVVKSRKHHILKAFASNQEPQELSLIGTVEMGLYSGKTIVSPFSCHIELDSSPSSPENPRIKAMEVFADTAPLAAALAE
ncbi:hypothetical protein GQ53DRAFT_845261 [Thozetella sp. PMI_491]|nr:hypothetical protein GQ53DRAFT_845261 [Thozetella sp. PMI_491]